MATRAVHEETYGIWTISVYYRGRPGKGEFHAVARSKGLPDWVSAGFRLAEHATSPRPSPG